MYFLREKFEANPSAPPPVNQTYLISFSRHDFSPTHRTQLRDAVNGLMTRQEAHEFDTFVLNRENEELRERIQFLESVISGEQEELLECM